MTKKTEGKTHGICYLAGAGPGDLGLVTLRTRDCIAQADVIVYDYLCNAEMLAWAKPEAERIYVGKKAGAHTLTQDGINALLVEKTGEGKIVTRLKGGDPFLFGRGGEEALALVEAGLKFEIIPGVSSALAAPAYAGIPVTHREIASQVTIFTGHENPEKSESALDFSLMAKLPGTKVMLMGVERLKEISDVLLDAGADPKTPVALVRWGTTGRQTTISGTLKTISNVAREAKFSAPAVAVFGEVVNLRKRLNWFETRPLFGKRIVVTRSRKQAGALTEKLRALGADVLEIPTIRIEPSTELKDFGQLVMDAHRYDWLIFTSPNGVDAFFEMFYKIYKDVREIGGARIAAIGPATKARLANHHLKVDLVPDKAVAEEIVRAFQKEESVENRQMLLVRPEAARDVVAEKLTALGAIVDEAIAYRTVPETADTNGAIARFKNEGADLITFTSSSTVENFLALKLPLPSGLKTASIGEITSQTMREAGLKIDAEAKSANIDSLVKAVLKILR